MCNRHEGQTYYAKSCLDGTCSNCAGMALLSQCMHKTGDNEFGNMVTDMKSFKYISYEIVPWKESKKIQLVTSQVHAFIYKIMFEQLHFIPYVQKNLIFRSFCVNRYKLVSSSRNLLKRHVNMYTFSCWFCRELHSATSKWDSKFPWWCISHTGMAQTVVKSKEKL